MSVRDCFKKLNISKATVYNLLNDRQLYGRLAYRRNDLRVFKAKKRGSKGSGRYSKFLEWIFTIVPLSATL